MAPHLLRTKCKYYLGTFRYNAFLRTSIQTYLSSINRWIPETVDLTNLRREEAELLWYGVLPHQRLSNQFNFITKDKISSRAC